MILNLVASCYLKLVGRNFLKIFEKAKKAKIKVFIQKKKFMLLNVRD